MGEEKSEPAPTYEWPENSAQVTALPPKPATSDDATEDEIMGRDKVEPLRPLAFQFNKWTERAWFNPVPECVQKHIDVENSTYMFIKQIDQFYALVTKYVAKNAQGTCQSFEI